MSFAQVIVIIVLVVCTRHILSLFNKKNREAIKNDNVKLDTLRKIPVKTLEQQKEFLDVRYPKKTGKFKFKWIMIPKWGFELVLYMGLFYVYNIGFNYMEWDIKFWQALLFTMIFPYLFNLVLRKVGGFQKKSDISVYFK